MELSASRERQEASAATGVGRAQFGCGVGLRSQIAFSVAMEQAEGDRSHHAALSGKTWLRELTEEDTGITIAWAAGFLHPHGRQLDREAYEVRAVVTHPVGRWLLHGNLGWLRSQTEHRDSTVWGAAIERLGLLGPIDAMFEFFGESGEKAWANAGLRWNAVPGQVFVDGSYGRQTGRDGGSLVTLGLKLAF